MRPGATPTAGVVGADFRRQHDSAAARSPTAPRCSASARGASRGVVRPEPRRAAARPAPGRPRRARSRRAVAHTAPPDVPLSPTTSYLETLGCSSRPRTPAVNAVWLPPPWQAMATRGRSGASGLIGVRWRGGARAAGMTRRLRADGGVTTTPWGPGRPAWQEGASTGVTPTRGAQMSSLAPSGRTRPSEWSPPLVAAARRCQAEGGGRQRGSPVEHAAPALTYVPVDADRALPLGGDGEPSAG